MKPHSNITVGKAVQTDYYPLTPSTKSVDVANWSSDVLSASAIVVHPKPFVQPGPHRFTVTDNKGFYGHVYWWAYGNYVGGPFMVRDHAGAIQWSIPDAIPRNRGNVYNTALSRLNEDVRGGLDLSIDLAEAGSTARMLKAHDHLKQFQNAWLKKAGSKYGLAKLLASKWLEWQYGVKPLLADIYAAHDEAARMALNRIKTFKASYSQPVRPTSSRIFVYNAYYNASVEGSGIEGCRFNIQFEVPGSIFDLERWTSMNPVSIAYELMSYSFVIDWFYNIGGMIRSLETGLLYKTRFKSGYYTELFAYNYSYSVNAGKPPPAGSTSNSYVVRGICSIKSIDFQRSVLSSYPLPGVPSFQAKLGWQRLLSAASLMTQFLPRH
jgi:hypothetical protein